MTLKRTHLTLIACFAVPLAPARGQKPSVWVRPEFGFRVELPDGWQTRDAEATQDRLLVHIAPPGARASGRFSIQVRPPAGQQAARALRDATLAALDGQPGYQDARALETRLSGRDVPGIGVDVVRDDVHSRVKIFYAVENGLLYTLQAAATAESFDELAPAFESIRDSFAFVQLTGARARQRTIAELAARCGSEIDWAASWDDAAARARAGKKLILVRARMLAGFQLTDSAMTGPFMDPDLVALINERYVALRVHKGMPVPFAAAELYGMSGSTFGQAFLLVTPDGRVVREGVGALDRLLLEGLTADPAHPGPPAPRVDDPLEQAEIHLRRGELDRALASLGEPATARAHRLAAAVHRVRHDGAAPLEHLQRARSAPGAAALAVDIDVDEALIRIRIGQLDEAFALLQRTVDEHGDHPRSAEARYWLGAVEQVRAGRRVAADHWNRLVDAQPDSRWAWKAAGALTGTAFSVGLGERLTWPEAEVAAAHRHLEPEPLPTSAADRAERDGVRYLLDHQRADGSWLSPSESEQFRADLPNDFTQAITAICAQALLQRCSDPAARAAVDRALDYAVAAFGKTRSAGDQRFFMDYSVWSRAYVLWFLADAVGAGLRDRDALAPLAAQLVADLRGKRKPVGGWSYYVTTDLESSASPSNQAMSFTTAAVVLALLRAREVGFDVPDDLIERGLDFVAAMHDEDNGTFDYWQVAGGGSTGRPGAAGRGPVCALALFRGGRGTVDDLRAALDIFVDHAEELGRETGKALMHAGRQAQGSHYLMFDYAYAAAAARELPATQRGEYRGAILEQVLRARSVEGSFRDNPLLGWDYGTGFAVTTFGLLRGL